MANYYIVMLKWVPYQVLTSKGIPV